MYGPLRDQAASLFSTGKVPLQWPSFPVIVPHRIRRKFRSTRSKLRSRQTPSSSSFTALTTSFSPTDTLHDLRKHQWSVYDGQYIILAFIGIFALCVVQNPGPLVKLVIAALLMTSLLIPITRQFFLPFLPIAGWLILFYAAQLVTSSLLVIT